MSEDPQGLDINSIIIKSAQEIKLNMDAISDVNNDLREYFYANRDTMTPDKKRQCGIYLKSYMDLKIKGLIELLVNHLKVARALPPTGVLGDELSKSGIDKAIEDLSPYEREKLRNSPVVNPAGSPV